MKEKLERLENQMKRLLGDFRTTCEKNESLRLENERLLHDLMEKNRRLEVFEERDSVLMEAQSEKKRLEERHQSIRDEVEGLLQKIRALRTDGEQ
jgi:peptidoglycan hydrolase CwlO-like protein